MLVGADIGAAVVDRVDNCDDPTVDELYECKPDSGAPDGVVDARDADGKIVGK